MACNELTWEKIQQNSTIKASIAPLIFDRLLLKGLFIQKDVSVDVLSFPSVAAYPASKKFAWGSIKEEILSGLSTRWLPAINLPGLKFFCFLGSTLFSCFFWLIKNRKDKTKQIVIYSSFLPVALPILFLSRLSGSPCTTIITDIPKYTFLNKKSQKKYLRYLIKPYVKLTELVQSKFDKYVFLTEHMNGLINTKNKPYIIIEAICDHKLFQDILQNNDESFKSVMYAGALNEKLGIPLLLEVISEITADIEVWIFGAGDFEKEVIKLSQITPRIKFFGKVNREIVLDYEIRATLLINLRNPEEEFTKYSFPSKNIEYMCSGTPLLTTKLPGIPHEYFQYVYTIGKYDKQELKDKIIEIILKDTEELDAFGKRASEFVCNKKNYIVQGQKLIQFLNKNNT